MSHSNRILLQLDGFGLVSYLKQTSLNIPQVSFVIDESDEETKTPAVADPVRSAAFLRNNCRARMVHQIDNFAYIICYLINSPTVKASEELNGNKPA